MPTSGARSEEALGYLDRLTTDYKSSPEVAAQGLLTRARILESRDRWGEALETYRSVPAQYPLTEQALLAPLEIAAHYDRVGDQAAAETALEQAERRLPGLRDEVSSGSADELCAATTGQGAHAAEEIRRGDHGNGVAGAGPGAGSDQRRCCLTGAADMAYRELSDSLKAADILERMGKTYEGSRYRSVGFQRGCPHPRGEVAMNFQKTALILALLTTVLPVVAVFLRGRTRRLVTLSTVLASASVAFMLVVVLQLVQDRSPDRSGFAGSTCSSPRRYAAAAGRLLLLVHLRARSCGRGAARVGADCIPPHRLRRCLSRAAAAPRVHPWLRLGGRARHDLPRIARQGLPELPADRHRPHRLQPGADLPDRLEPRSATGFACR